MSKTNRKKRSYTEEFKTSVLKRLELPTNDTITSISNELGVPRSTIYQWINRKNRDNNKDSINHKSTSKWTSEYKFHAVIETSSLTEIELRRKDKALAETAALLVLRKKANAI